MITLSNVTKKFKNSNIIFDNFSYLFENKIYQIIGPNGVGKSVLLKIIAEIDKNIDGMVRNDLKNKPILFLSDTGIGIPFLSIKENILLSAKILNLDIEYEQFNKLFQEDEFLLNGFYENSSLGNKNKVGLSLLYANSKMGLIILDEALNGLDDNSKKSIFTQLNRIANDGTCPILIVSHSDDLTKYCHNVTKVHLKEFYEY